MRYRALVLGAGQIGACYDRPGSSAPPLTYAHAIQKNPDLELVGFVEPDQHQGASAIERWGGTLFPDLSAAWESGAVDVVCLAVPDEYHYQVLCQLTDFPFRILLAEKPFTLDPTQATEVLAKYHTNGTPVLVNYSRRHLPAFADLAGQIRAGKFGPLLQAVGYYGKGSLHNGSHMVNLLLFLLGEVSFHQRLSSIEDYRAGDPTASVLLSGGPWQSPIALHGIDSRAVSLFELDLLFLKQRIRMVQSGKFLEFFEVQENPDFPGYRNFSLVDTQDTALLSAMSHLLEKALSILEGTPTPQDDLLDAVKTLEICSKFLA